MTPGRFDRTDSDPQSLQKRAEEAVWHLVELAKGVRSRDQQLGLPACPESEALDDSIATLSGLTLVAVEKGMHVYQSRYKVGDQVVVLHGRHASGAIVLGGPFKVTAISSDGMLSLEDETSVDRQKESDCFPTRDEAQAEAERRNGGAE